MLSHPHATTTPFYALRGQSSIWLDWNDFSATFAMQAGRRVRDRIALQTTHAHTPDRASTTPL